MTPVIFLVAIAVVALDRVTKIAAASFLSAGESAGIIPGIFHFTLVLNKGAAFGLFKEGTAFFIIVSALAIAVIIYYALKHENRRGVLSTALGLILGGASGNLIDRVRLGYVIDFLDFRIWPVFNIADSAITIGAVMLAIHICTRSLQR